MSGLPYWGLMEHVSRSVPWVLVSGWRLFGMLLITIAVPVICLISFTLIQFYHALQEEAVEQNIEASRITLEAMNDHFDTLARFVKQLAEEPNFVAAVAANDQTAIQSYLNEFLLDYPEFIGITINDLKNEVDSVRTPSLMTFTNQIGYGHVLVAQYPLSAIARTLAQLRPSFAGSLVLIDSYAGTIIALDNIQDIIAIYRYADFQELTAVPLGTLLAHDPISGKESLMSYRSSASGRWWMLAYQPLSTLFAPFYAALQTILISAGMMIAAMVALGLLWLQTIRRYHQDRQQTEADLIHKTEQFVRTRVELEQLELFAFATTHSLQEPLHKIVTYGRLLQKKTSDVQEQEYLQKLLIAVEKMSSLLEQLRDFARIVTEGEPLLPTHLDIVLSRVLSKLAPTIQALNATIEVGTLPVVSADAKQMHVVFEQLIRHALRNRKQGESPCVHVSSRLLKESGMIEIAIRDKGIGFEEKYLDRLFQPFQKLSRMNGEEIEGLELAICKKIVMRHGGNISAQNAPGKESTFLITLPKG